MPEWIDYCSSTHSQTDMYHNSWTPNTYQRLCMFHTETGGERGGGGTKSKWRGRIAKYTYKFNTWS